MFKYEHALKVMSNRYEDENIIKKAKGIAKSALKEITFDDYHKCLFQNIKVWIIKKSIISRDDDVYTISQQKIALSPFDNKQIVNYVYTDTKPWGFNDFL